jgi:PEP-CTERM motif
MKLRLLAVAATAAAALAAGSANATVVSAFFDPLAWAAPAGQTDITQFETGSAPATLGNVIFSQPGYSLSGNAQLVTGSNGNSAAAATPSSASVNDPSTGRDGTQYLSIQGGQSATLKVDDLTTISFYIGSIDTYNTLSFEYADGTFETPILTGTWVSDNTISQSNGDQQNGDTNGRLTLTFSKPIEAVVLGSASNSFEISDVAGIKAAVPEPTSWALMILGFGGAGAVLRGQRRRQASAATA